MFERLKLRRERTTIPDQESERDILARNINELARTAMGELDCHIFMDPHGNIVHKEFTQSGEDLSEDKILSGCRSTGNFGVPASYRGVASLQIVASELEYAVNLANFRVDGIPMPPQQLIIQ